jgi:hypothetical protein
MQPPLDVHVRGHRSKHGFLFQFTAENVESVEILISQMLNNPNGSAHSAISAANQ